MRSKNSAAITADERAHLERVKLLPCSVCGAGGGHAAPSEAHHIEQGSHYLCIPCCADCHRGSFNGLHGQRRIWKVLKKTELTCLNDTIARVMADLLRRQPTVRSSR